LPSIRQQKTRNKTRTTGTPDSDGCIAIYENATNQLKNVIKTQKYTLGKRKKKYAQTHGITVR